MKENEAKKQLTKLPTFKDSHWVHQPSKAVGYLEAHGKAKGLVEGIETILSLETLRDIEEQEVSGYSGILYGIKIALTDILEKYNA